MGCGAKGSELPRFARNDSHQLASNGSQRLARNQKQLMVFIARTHERTILTFDVYVIFLSIYVIDLYIPPDFNEFHNFLNLIGYHLAVCSL